jgi:hypothetical protein
MTSMSETQAKKSTLDDCNDDPKNPGKSPIVTVSFTPPETFVFSCAAVTMRASGKIQMHQASEKDQWTFVRPNELPEPEFTYKTGGNGKTMTIEDKHTKPGEFHYTITVRDSTGEHTSPERIVTNPPMIRNQ